MPTINSGLKMFYKNALFFIDTDNFDHFATLKKMGFTLYKYQGIKIWCTPFYHIAEKILSKCSYSVDVEKAMQKHRCRFYMSDEKGEEQITPKNKTHALYPFQGMGVGYIQDAVNDYKAVLVADDMGLGKTIEAICFCNYLPEEMKNILVVCPATLKDNWKKEWKIWSVKKRLPEIINYERLISRPDLTSKPWDLVIIDEAHYIKNPQAKRTKAVVGCREQKGLNTKIKMALTGTPILNRPIELFPILRWLLPTGFSDRMVFARKYCGLKHNGFGWDMNGSSNLDELQLKLRSTIMLRRKKEDVLKQLPPKRRQIIEIEPTSEMQALLNIENKMLGFQFGSGFLKKETLTDEEYRRTVKTLTIGGGLPGFEEMSRYRSMLGELKIPFVKQHIQDCIDEGIKLVVFAHHKKVIAALYERFKDICVMLTGETNTSKRQQIVEDFQQKDKIRLFLGNIVAAGTGITLTASHQAVFAEHDWSPGRIEQPEDRLCRIGQTEGVLIQHLVVAGSLDALMCKTVVHKAEIIDGAMNMPDVNFMEGL